MAYSVFADKLGHLPRLIIKSVPLRKQLVEYALLICSVDNVDNDLLRLQETVNSMYCLYKVIKLVINADKYCPVAMFLKIAARTADNLFCRKKSDFALRKINCVFLSDVEILRTVNLNRLRQSFLNRFPLTFEVVP